MGTTANRVSAQTSDEINRRLRLQMEERLAYYETHPDEIDTRLAELDREWDIERTLEANASTLAFTGTMLAATGDRRWLALPAIVTGFLFQHAISGVVSASADPAQAGLPDSGGNQSGTLRIEGAQR